MKKILSEVIDISPKARAAGLTHRVIKNSASRNKKRVASRHEKKPDTNITEPLEIVLQNHLRSSNRFNQYLADPERFNSTKVNPLEIHDIVHKMRMKARAKAAIGKKTSFRELLSAARAGKAAIKQTKAATNAEDAEYFHKTDRVLKGAFKKEKSSKDKILYHGLSDAKAVEHLQANYNASHPDSPTFEHEAKTYMSTSTNPKSALGFAKLHSEDGGHANHMLAISVPKGSASLDVYSRYPHSQYRKEHEVLLQRGAKFVIRKRPTTFKNSDSNVTTQVWHAKMTHDGTKEDK